MDEATGAETTEIIPLHQFADKDGYVLLVKCVNADMTSYGGFVWPESGPVRPTMWERDNACDTGGLFGWPLGVGIGIGKDPLPNGKWIVFRALPENVLAIEYGKANAIPGDDGALPEVVYCGTMAGAMLWTMKQRQAWIAQASSGSASASGDSGSAQTTGQWSSALVSGKGGIATSSYRAQAGEEGAFMLRWHDGERWQFAAGVVGQDGIEAGVWYVVRRDGKLAAE